jgi:hypothetical protein
MLNELSELSSVNVNLFGAISSSGQHATQQAATAAHDIADGKGRKRASNNT